MVLARIEFTARYVDISRRSVVNLAGVEAELTAIAMVF